MVKVKKVIAILLKQDEASWKLQPLQYFWPSAGRKPLFFFKVSGMRPLGKCNPCNTAAPGRPWQAGLVASGLAKSIRFCSWQTGPRACARWLAPTA